MNINQILAVALVGATAITGCMSLDERLASSDPRVKNEAERELIQSSREYGDEAARIAAVKRITNKDLLFEIAAKANSAQTIEKNQTLNTVKEGLAALTKIDDDNAFVRLSITAASPVVRQAAFDRIKSPNAYPEIASKATDVKIVRAAFNKVSDEKDYVYIVRNAVDSRLRVAAYNKIQDQQRLLDLALESKDRQVVLKGIGRVKDKEKLLPKVFAPTHVAPKVPAKPTPSVVYKRDGRGRVMPVAVPKQNGKGDNDANGKPKVMFDVQLVDAFIANCFNDVVLAKVVRDYGGELTPEQCATIKRKSKSAEVQSAIAEIADKKILVALERLEAEYQKCAQDDKKDLVAKKAGDLFASLSPNASVQHFGMIKTEFTERDKIYQVYVSRLPENEKVKVVLNGIAEHSVYAWNNDNLIALETGIDVISHISDTKLIVRIASAVLNKVAEYREECKKSWTMHWDSGDEKKAAKLLAGLTSLSPSAIDELVCSDGSIWRHFIDKVTPESAYNILTHGNAKSDELEVALVKKLPQSKVDMKVFSGVKSDSGKKAVMEAMPADVKKAAQESTERAFSAVMQKAKDARKETFELQGFYLGMDWEDMKIVLSHHFPEYEIKEERDGESADAAYIIDLPSQRSPFCYASAKDKRVYQFDFGKKMLKKWYPYDVQTFMEWAHTYSRENKIDMKYKEIEKEATVYEPMDMSRSYRVWFYQESYQYKHNTKDYRLIYFGEEKDSTFHGGVGGALIKKLAAHEFRYVRGDPGSLRVAIEND